MKVIVNIFDPNRKHSTSSVYDDSGVKRCFILALVEHVSEDNSNLQKVFDPLKLGEVDYSLAFDMKCGTVSGEFLVMLENMLVSTARENAL